MYLRYNQGFIRYGPKQRYGIERYGTDRTVGILVVPVPYRKISRQPCTVPFCTVGFPKIPYWPVPAKCTGHLDRYRTVYMGQIIVYRMFHTGRQRANNGPTMSVQRYAPCHVYTYMPKCTRPYKRYVISYWIVVCMIQSGTTATDKYHLCDRKVSPKDATDTSEQLSWRLMPPRERKTRPARRNQRASPSQSSLRLRDAQSRRHLSSQQAVASLA